MASRTISRVDRPRWKLERHEVPPELAENFVVRHLASLTPEEDASLEHAEELDATLGDGRPSDE